MTIARAQQIARTVTIEDYPATLGDSIVRAILMAATESAEICASIAESERSGWLEAGAILDWDRASENPGSMAAANIARKIRDMKAVA